MQFIPFIFRVKKKHHFIHLLKTAWKIILIICFKVSKHLTFVAKKLVYFAKHVQNLIRVCYIHLECF